MWQQISSKLFMDLLSETKESATSSVQNSSKPDVEEQKVAIRKNPA